jgi:hypothetical protein
MKIRIRDEHFGSYFRELRNNFFGLKYLNSLMPFADRGIFLTLDQGSGTLDGIHSDPGSGIKTSRIRNTDISYSIISLRTELQKIDRGP